MGTDIHGFAQRFLWTESNGTEHWYAFSAVPDDRCYALFAVLANVRNSWPLDIISEPRGLPTAIAPGDIGDHSYTYFTPVEILEWKGWTQSVRYNYGAEEYNLTELQPVRVFLAWCRYLAEYDTYGRVTIVLGFDN